MTNPGTMSKERFDICPNTKLYIKCFLNAPNPRDIWVTVMVKKRPKLGSKQRPFHVPGVLSPAEEVRDAVAYAISPA